MTLNDQKITLIYGIGSIIIDSTKLCRVGANTMSLEYPLIVDLAASRYMYNKKCCIGSLFQQNAYTIECSQVQKIVQGHGISGTKKSSVSRLVIYPHMFTHSKTDRQTDRQPPVACPEQDHITLVDPKPNAQRRLR